MPKTFVIGDIHGSHRALLQCFEISGFDFQKDTLICLGDVVDGWPGTCQSISLLLQARHLIYIKGNHDFWALDWMETGYANEAWLAQGGQATIHSYGKSVPQGHIQLLRNALPYYVLHNQLFVHAGIDINKPMDKQDAHDLFWGRDFARLAKAQHGTRRRLTSYEAVFIGHTPVMEGKPVQYCEVWMMDTGAGWSGRLSMMNINTGECFVSDPVPELYPGIKGREN
ncbi:MAG: metallophosphoesterase [Cyclobacteriaceae bacterium]|nr:metallophosphoesterase [Cyclobacteriaceae bacterium]MCB0498836.1 metallophosphoesterase [Cyclobacteriaceae bacterium]MCB9237650.1 metallophosphoesterase [Flammeovirgaceae bacterium]MCO5270248.1 metallophosphoesterase [Cyclobacteriaceae bacterium]MCW5902224.1 metallophosphoesterase [Cyclobacteriaceae bacterium]